MSFFSPEIYNLRLCFISVSFFSLQEMYEGESLTYGDVSVASGVEENIYSFRGSTLRGKERGVGGSSSSRNLVDEPSDDEEDDGQVEPLVMALEEFEDLVEE